MPKDNKVIVEGVNVATCHTKPRKQGEQGGIVKKETPIRACKVALYCGKCGKGVRIGFQVEGERRPASAPSAAPKSKREEQTHGCQNERKVHQRDCSRTHEEVPL